MEPFPSNPQDLHHIIHLLQQAQSPHNHLQQQVFSTLKDIEQHPISYFYLATIFNATELAPSIRLLAGLTLNSALKRNASFLAFTPPQLQQLKEAILSQQQPQYQKTKCTLISTLMNFGSFDYSLFDLLLSQLPAQPVNIHILNFTLEDVKGDSQNNNLFSEPKFMETLQKIYEQLLGILNSLQKEDLRSNEWVPQYLKCLNSLTFHCPPQLHSQLNLYLSTVIKGILSLAQQEELNPQVTLLALEGFNEIVATKATIAPPQWVDLVVSFSSLRGNSTQMEKCWTNIMIELIEKDEGQAMQGKLQVLLPKAIRNLTFTQEDQTNMKFQMEVEYNPYNEGGSAGDELEDEDLTEKGFSGDTLRRLSFILLRKIAINYADDLWLRWGKDVRQGLQSSNPTQKQTATAFLGIITQTCFQSFSSQVQDIVSLLVHSFSSSPEPLVRATSLWTLEKLLPFCDQKFQVMEECLKIIQTSTEFQSKNTVSMMYQQACVSLIDTFLQWEGVSEVLQQSTHMLEIVTKFLAKGLTFITGRALLTVLKAISSIFELPLPESPFLSQIWIFLIQSLNELWGKNQGKDSVVCPLLECLITAYEQKPHHLQPYLSNYLQIILPLLMLQHRTALVLRCLDFLSSIVSHSEQQQALKSKQFIQLLLRLLGSSEKQIVHFTEGLLTDVAKKYDISLYLDSFVSAVAQTINQKGLTSLNNGLSCLTELLIKYHPTSARFLPEVIDKILLTLGKQRLEPIIAFNLARNFGRLSLLDPGLAKQKMLQDPRCVKMIFLSLRTREVSVTANAAFRGLVELLLMMSHEQTLLMADNIECVIDALICYPIRVEAKPEDQQLILKFIVAVKKLRQELGDTRWQKVTELPIFLPGSLKTLSQWLSTPS